MSCLQCDIVNCHCTHRTPFHSFSPTTVHRPCVRAIPKAGISNPTCPYRASAVLTDTYPNRCYDKSMTLLMTIAKTHKSAENRISNPPTNAIHKPAHQAVKDPLGGPSLVGTSCQCRLASQHPVEIHQRPPRTEDYSPPFPNT